MIYSAPYHRIMEAAEIISIAEACLGGLRGRSALLIGSAEERHPYVVLLQKAGMKYVYQEETPEYISPIIPHIQLLIRLPASTIETSMLTAATIAAGCSGRIAPLVIFDLASSTSSVEELAGLLPAVCLYTPQDIQQILAKAAIQI